MFRVQALGFCWFSFPVSGYRARVWGSGGIFRFRFQGCVGRVGFRDLSVLGFGGICQLVQGLGCGVAKGFSRFRVWGCYGFGVVHGLAVLGFGVGGWLWAFGFCGFGLLRVWVCLGFAKGFLGCKVWG